MIIVIILLMIGRQVYEVALTVSLCHFCLYHRIVILFNKVFAGLPHAITILKVCGSYF
jgi:disulfide bond formation protein DsbB